MKPLITRSCGFWENEYSMKRVGLQWVMYVDQNPCWSWNYSRFSESWESWTFISTYHCHLIFGVGKGTCLLDAKVLSQPTYSSKSWSLGLTFHNKLGCKLYIVRDRGVASGGKRVTECTGPRGLGARDRLAIGSTGTFHSSSGQIAETREISPILGAVLNYSACETA